MAIQTLSQPTLRKAHELALKGHLWHTGRSKINGRAFYLIPSQSTPGTAHRTTHYGCTCTSYRHRGDCVHVEAVRMFEAREAVTRKPRYEDLWPDDEYGTVSAF